MLTGLSTYLSRGVSERKDAVVARVANVHHAMHHGKAVGAAAASPHAPAASAA